MVPSTWSGRAAAVALCAGLAACSGAQPVAYSGIAASPYLKPSTQDDAARVPLRYSEAVDWRAYDRAIVEPVAIYRGPDAQFGDMAEADKADLARYMQGRFAEKLGGRFALAATAGPRTLRVTLTLTGATASTAVLSTATRFDLTGGLYNAVQTVRGREGMFTGDVLYAVEISDSESGRLLAAFVAKQYPTPFNIGATFGALGAARTGIDKGAEALAAEFSPPARS